MPYIKDKFYFNEKKINALKRKIVNLKNNLIRYFVYVVNK